MKLDDIGFYTLEDNRAKNVSINSDMWRCELILTSRCNFNCPYCRGISDFKKDLSFEDAKSIITKWTDNNLRNIRFSGGEPTLYKNLIELVKFTKSRNVKRIAISTNGYSNLEYYKKLINSGVNDISISLDACCSSVGDMMSGGIKGSWNKVVNNIRELSKLTYVTVGVVMNDSNIEELDNISEFAYSLGVSDIRILSAAQWNNSEKFKNICTNNKILNSNPILKYRINNFNNGRNVRGIKKSDCHKCYLMLDDMVVMKNKHYPCIIYMREKGTAIGTVKNKSIFDIRKERLNYLISKNTYEDNICKNNCLDVCVDYNNKVRELQRKHSI